MIKVSLEKLLEAGCHFGHRTSRWHPKMAKYIYKAQGKVHIIDLAKTKAGLEEAAAFAKATAAEGDQIIFIATKREARQIVQKAAEEAGMPYVTYRWLGGLITNWEKIKGNLDRLKDLKAKREAGEFKEYTKKERLQIDRGISRQEKVLGGLQSLEDLPAAIFVVDVRTEEVAVREAAQRGVKVIGIVDTNSNPDLVDYVIPANDDAPKSIGLIVGLFAEAVEEGKKKFKVQSSKFKSKEENKDESRTKKT